MAAETLYRSTSSQKWRSAKRGITTTGWPVKTGKCTLKKYQPAVSLLASDALTASLALQREFSLRINDGGRLRTIDVVERECCDEDVAVWEDVEMRKDRGHVVMRGHHACGTSVLAFDVPADGTYL